MLHHTLCLFSGKNSPSSSTSNFLNYFGYAILVTILIYATNVLVSLIMSSQLLELELLQ